MMDIVYKELPPADYITMILALFGKSPWLRESHAVIRRDRVVPASQVPFPGEPSGEPGNGTWRAGTTLYRRNDSVGFFFSPVTIIEYTIAKN